MIEGSKAAALVEAAYKLERAEAELGETLVGIGYDHYTYDDYDDSLEIYGVTAGRELTSEELARLKAFGFGQVWTHTQLARCLGGDDERHYRLPKS